MTTTLNTRKAESTQAAELLLTLNRQQANALVTYLNYKKYHWLTFGPLFRDLHLLFEEHATEVLAMVDELAERTLMLDGTPLADPEHYLPATTVKPSEGQLSVRQMVEEAIANHDIIIAEMHEDAEVATNVGDIGTADLYTRLVQIHQKQRWFLKELLKRGDGLSA
ncbi:Dps family protein [Pantanalinema sp. GBBB05]|uniref:Dps family protein n=1 Tax=Pantanalinema sp. GBBB05 TaxID=2604139 RepID=UPI001DFB37AB|nr:DNA starvation/stationary phase protection protein [Pantanalinema sp. GBBB05]